MAKAHEALAPLDNCVLAALPPNQLERLWPRLTPVELTIKEVIYEPNQPVRHVWFPENGMISVVSLMDGGGIVEVGTIGREGISGAFLLLDTPSVPYQHFVQVPGHAHRMEASFFKEEAERSWVRKRANVIE